jgi:DedD protein
MARPISDEELQLKKRARRRLVGAIVLVSAVAVILPMVLDSEPKSVSKNVDIRIPPSDSTEFKPKAVLPMPHVIEGSVAVAPPTVAPPADKAGATPDADPSAASKAASPAGTDGTSGSAKSVGSASSVAVSEHAPATAQPASEGAKPDVTEAKPRVSNSAKEGRAPAKDQPKASGKGPSASANAFIVQVAALTDAARAKQLQKQISGAGVKTYTEVVSTKSGNVTRVRAGPYSTREAAEKARTQLKKVGLDGKVVPK